MLRKSEDRTSCHGQDVYKRQELDHVSFTYPGSSEVLHDIDLTVAAGETVAIVGPSGGGKSTLCQLVPRFYDVTEGSIRVDGLDAVSYTHLAVGILQALAATGAVTFEIALPIIMGIAIGAAVPVLLSALGANVSGKRTAFVYLLDVYKRQISSSGSTRLAAARSPSTKAWMER